MFFIHNKTLKQLTPMELTLAMLIISTNISLLAELIKVPSGLSACSNKWFFLF
jgi:hypothetical protein